MNYFSFKINDSRPKDISKVKKLTAELTFKLLRDKALGNLTRQSKAMTIEQLEHIRSM